MVCITNAAEDDACCDVCGEPNRTGESVVYVSQEWCNRNELTYSEELKLCIWCRVGTVKRRNRGVRMPNYSEIQEETKRIKECKEGRNEKQEQENHTKESHTQSTIGHLATVISDAFDRFK